jgi:hypothetical protein
MLESNRSMDVAIFSGLDFLSVFFSMLKTKNVNVVSSDKLLKIIGRHRDDFLELFIDMDIINNCGTVYSYELEEGISMLQILGAIGKSNPKFERIILKMHKETAYEMIQNCPVYYRNKIEDFVTVFLSEISGEQVDK